MKSIAVIGAGAWGTSLAARFAEAGGDVLLWAREPEVVESINNHHENTLFLKGITLPANLRSTSNLEALAGARALFLVPPAQFMGVTVEAVQKAGLGAEVPMVICSKGIDTRTRQLMSEVIAERVKNPLAVLSGPTFADEVAKGLPFAATLACGDDTVRQKLVSLANGASFRLIPSSDIIGAQIGGAVKNVVAIACGVMEGRALGQNAKAAVLTQGLREMSALTLAKGGKAKTMLEPCGVGDLTLTCGSAKSRNMSLGLALGQGTPLKEILASRNSVTEGIASAEAIHLLASELGITMPVCDAVYRFLHQDMPLDKAVQTLISAS
ncbi:MAG: NAD(P)-dependent glycerol-3-phosphate dehydrogenase [Rickettsiales bacterium]|nr:NAD(P)-dependent glycerol-3-phosphate dehydrogenase [Rickettsiales bacterium]